MPRRVREPPRAALDGRPPVIRSDGTLRRDFLYVEDAVRAYQAICGLVHEGRGAGEAFNAGGERPYSVLEVVETTCRVAGAHVTPQIRGDGTHVGEIECQ